MSFGNKIILKSGYLWALILNLSSWIYWNLCAKIENSYLKEVKEEFRRRRDYLFEELKEIFEVDIRPQGAFYIWADVSKYSDDSFEFAQELLKKLHIATTPGVDFGKNGTKKYIRFAYTRDIEHMKVGINRLKKHLFEKK